jgi:hypothetical protein
MHLDNAHPQNSRKLNEYVKEFDAGRVSLPAHNLDLMLRDFFLFGILKTELQNDKIHRRDDLISAIRSIFDEISKKTLNSVYDSWKKRLKCVIKHEWK